MLAGLCLVAPALVTACAREPTATAVPRLPTAPCPTAGLPRTVLGGPGWVGNAQPVRLTVRLGERFVVTTAPDLQAFSPPAVVVTRPTPGVETTPPVVVALCTQVASRADGESTDVVVFRAAAVGSTSVAAETTGCGPCANYGFEAVVRVLP